MGASPRRLCMVVHAPYPRGETRVEREAHAAQERGWEVDVVALREPGDAPDEVGADGVRIVRVPVARRRGASAATAALEYLRFTWLAARAVARLHRERHYAVVQVHNPPDFLVLAALVPRLRGARVVLDIHDFAPELFALRFGGRRGSALALALLARIEQVATTFADAVVTVHEPYRRSLVAKGVPGEKITVALNTPEERLLPAPRVEPAGDRFRVVYHGTVTRHYGLPVLVEAVSLLGDSIPSLVVEVYGGGDALPEVQALVSEKGLDDRFWFSGGFIDNREVLDKILGAQVGVVAALPLERNQAAVPTKLFEYAAIGVPIVSSNLAAVREYFSADEVGRFEGDDPAALAEQIALLARDPDAAAARAARARARYDDYRWSVDARRYLDLLDSLAARSRRS